MGGVRSVLAIEYANTAATDEGVAAFPTSLTAAYFANGTLPINKLNGESGIITVTTAASGTATHASGGFWYITSSGIAGAYSDGTINTATY